MSTGATAGSQAETATCTLCSKDPASGFYTGCMIQDVACSKSGWECDGRGNLTKSPNASAQPRLVSMTLETAKRIYIEAGGNRDHSESEWQDVHREMESIVAAASERSAARVIEWWGCWDRKYTATAFARRVRASHANATGSATGANEEGDRNHE